MAIFKRPLVLQLACFVLHFGFLRPSLAKGGGRSGRRGWRSGRKISPNFKRLYGDTHFSLAMLWNPFGCSNEPLMGEPVLVSPTVLSTANLLAIGFHHTQSADIPEDKKYIRGTVVRNEPRCNFVVQLNPNLAYPRQREQKEGSLIVELSTERNFFLHIVILIICGVFRWKTRHRRWHNHRANAFDAVFDQEVETDLPNVAISGIYTGTTEERNTGLWHTHQSVRVQLEFRDGAVSGFGWDSEDGHYCIKDGRYVGTGARWTEHYPKFTVQVRGTWECCGTEQQLHCLFLSSRGIAGTVSLTKERTRSNPRKSRIPRPNTSAKSRRRKPISSRA